MIVKCMFKNKIIEKMTIFTNEYFVDPILEVDCQHYYMRMLTNDRERLPPVGVSGMGIKIMSYFSQHEMQLHLRHKSKVGFN